MDKLFFCRISDKPSDVIQYSRVDDQFGKTCTITIFSVDDRLFTYTEYYNSDICWVSEIAKYNKDTAKQYPTKIGQPGGHQLIRLKLLSKKQVFTSLNVISDFIQSTANS